MKKKIIMLLCLIGSLSFADEMKFSTSTDDSTNESIEIPSGYDEETEKNIEKLLSLSQGGLSGIDNLINNTKKIGENIESMKRQYSDLMNDAKEVEIPKYLSFDEWDKQYGDQIMPSQKKEEYEKYLSLITEETEGLAKRTKDQLRNIFSTSDGGLFNTIGDIKNVVDKGVDSVLTGAEIAGDATSFGLSVAALVPNIMGTGVGHYGSIANTIQSFLGKLQQMRQRLEALKQYSRWIEEKKNFGKSDMMSIKGMKDTLSSLEEIVRNSGVKINELERNFATTKENRDTSTVQGWDSKTKDDITILKDTNKTIETSALTEKILKIINDEQKRLSSITPNTEKQQLGVLISQNDLLITLFSKLVSDQSRSMGDLALKNQRMMQEEIADNNIQKKNIINLNNYKNELKRKINRNNQGVPLY